MDRGAHLSGRNQQPEAQAKLKVFRLDEGGAAHFQIDNRQLVGDVMSDWAVEVFALSSAGAAASES